MSDKCMAIGCENGEVWTECCNGSGSCPCEGKQVLFGKCALCKGTGVQPDGLFTAKANLIAIRNAAIFSGGLLGNPHGKLR